MTWVLVSHTLNAKPVAGPRRWEEYEACMDPASGLLISSSPVPGLYGKSRHERYVDENGAIKKRTRHLPMDQWHVLIHDYHPGFIDWATFEANQKRLDSNTRPGPHRKGGIVREGSALLQGIGVCGHCGRRLKTHYRGRNSTPGYHCAGKNIVEGRALYCLNVGGVAIDQAIATAFLEAVTPAAVDA